METDVGCWDTCLDRCGDYVGQWRFAISAYVYVQNFVGHNNCWEVTIVTYFVNNSRKYMAHFNLLIFRCRPSKRGFV
jgi:hypothetical protein